LKILSSKLDRFQTFQNEPDDKPESSGRPDDPVLYLVGLQVVGPPATHSQVHLATSGTSGAPRHSALRHSASIKDTQPALKTLSIKDTQHIRK